MLAEDPNPRRNRLWISYPSASKRPEYVVCSFRDDDPCGSSSCALILTRGARNPLEVPDEDDRTVQRADRILDDRRSRNGDDPDGRFDSRRVSRDGDRTRASGTPGTRYSRRPIPASSHTNFRSTVSSGSDSAQVADDVRSSPQRRPITSRASDARLVTDLLAGADVQVNGGRPWDVQVHDERFFSRAIGEGILGLGESYMDGWWECERLDELFDKVLRADLDTRIRTDWRLASHLVLSRIVNLQTKRGSREIAETHYDLDADLYMSFLDPYNQYTCGYFKDTARLDEAQERKLDLICRKLELGPEARVLDIGCGWGGFAKFAAERYGCSVTGITISPTQAAFARDFCGRLDVDVLEMDYRDLPRVMERGSFTRIVTVGMIEHVGYRNYRTFFEAVEHCLDDRGLYLLHTIGGRGSVTTMNSNRFIAKYIFPNSMLPSLRQLAGAAEGIFQVEDLHNFGPRHYDQTLLAWWTNFARSWSRLRSRYDDRFYRMWRFYLLPTAGGFRAGRQTLWQFVLSKTDSPRSDYEAVR
jgi:cyclopropane-fatty-acyl-phospholipid synthase